VARALLSGPKLIVEEACAHRHPGARGLKRSAPKMLARDRAACVPAVTRSLISDVSSSGTVPLIVNIGRP
jgi:hypothetical protein